MISKKELIDYLLMVCIGLALSGITALTCDNFYKTQRLTELKKELKEAKKVEKTVRVKDKIRETQ